MTRYGMIFNQRDFVLITVPFSDLSSSKRRPAVVLSGDIHNAQSPDIVIAAITSNLAASVYGVVINPSDMEGGILPHTSLVRPDKIYSLSKTLVVRKFERLTVEAFERVLTALDLVITR